ncbi:uncharacterized protein DUF397 [Streptomyces sp. TLI_55]|nr:uncharacterized protein DUF397 [Streptomyces sp. TLI_55]
MIGTVGPPPRGPRPVPADGDCPDITDARPGVAPVRDSENPDGPRPAFCTGAQAAFVQGVALMT